MMQNRSEVKEQKGMNEWGCINLESEGKDYSVVQKICCYEA